MENFSREKKEGSIWDKNQTTPTIFNFNTEFQIVKKEAVKIFNYEYEFDEFAAPAISKLIRYFNNDTSLEDEKFSLYKGILLSGGIGSGKSDVIELIRKYILRQKKAGAYRTFSAETITSDYAAKGTAGLSQYVHNPIINSYGYEVRNPFVLCIDDLGIENRSVKHYGDSEDVISKLLYQRYELFKTGTRTHATTNLDVAGLKERYDDRIMSRISEMFNIIVLHGTDRRKNCKYKKISS